MARVVPDEKIVACPTRVSRVEQLKSALNARGIRTYMSYASDQERYEVRVPRADAAKARAIAGELPETSLVAPGRERQPRVCLMIAALVGFMLILGACVIGRERVRYLCTAAVLRVHPETTGRLLSELPESMKGRALHDFAVTERGRAALVWFYIGELNGLDPRVLPSLQAYAASDARAGTDQFMLIVTERGVDLSINNGGLSSIMRLDIAVIENYVRVLSLHRLLASVETRGQCVNELPGVSFSFFTGSCFVDRMQP